MHTHILQQAALNNGSTPGACPAAHNARERPPAPPLRRSAVSAVTAGLLDLLVDWGQRAAAGHSDKDAKVSRFFCLQGAAG